VAVEAGFRQEYVKLDGGRMGAGVLTKEQRLEMQAVGKEALAELTKHQPTYASMMAGAAFGGQIWGVLDTFFEELHTVGQKMPQEFSPSSVEADFLADVDTKASAYLATDLFRPRAGWSWSAKKRALKRELQDVMDKRALMALLYLKQAHAYRDFYRSLKKA
jgi:hypothetical protein